MESLWQDLRYGIRTLLRSPGFAAVAILTLAVGIAANTAIFSLVNAFFLRPLPFDNPGELVHIWQTDRERGHDELRVSVPNYLDWREQNTVFADLGGYFYSSFNLSSDEEPASVLVGRTDHQSSRHTRRGTHLGTNFLTRRRTTGQRQSHRAEPWVLATPLRGQSRDP